MYVLQRLSTLYRTLKRASKISSKSKALSSRLRNKLPSSSTRFATIR